MWSTCFWAVLLLPSIAPPAAAEKMGAARFIIIDDREGLTPEVLEAYTAAVGGTSETPVVNKRVRILATHRHGFNADPVALPNHVRSVNVDVTVNLRGAPTLRAPISVNRLTVSRRLPSQIKQATNVIGH